MADLYDKIFRQVALRAGQLQADSAAALSTAYNQPLIGQTELADRGVEAPESAIEDAILNASDRLISMIGANSESPFRAYFAAKTALVSSGDPIPTVSSTNKPRVGVLDTVFDGTTTRALVKRPYPRVIGYSAMETLRQRPYWYYDDGSTIWHTRGQVTLGIVVWSKVDQRILMTQGTARGENPFPEDLHEAQVCGALSYLFKSTWNNDQVSTWRAYFEQTLASLGPQTAQNAA